MLIELKSIQHNRQMSEETPCYSANLYWKGVHVGIVSNRGHGGPDEVYAAGGRDKSLQEAIAFVKSLPAIPSKHIEGGLPMDLELWCHIELDRIEDEKRLTSMFRRDRRSKIVCQKDDGIFTYRYKGVKDITARHLEHFKAEHPDCIILNEMTEADALAIYIPTLLKEAKQNEA